MFLKLLLISVYYTRVYSYGWVPLLDLKSYNTKIPSEIKICDKTVVVWEKGNDIIVQDNACMHRMGPLSEGYIDKSSKNLRCSYHGWEFDCNGKVVSIPQKSKVTDDDSSKFLHACKYKQKTYDTVKSCNILWINLNDTLSEFPSHISKYNEQVSTDTTSLEVPYNMNTLLENLFDPAHIPFAHHKLQSFRELGSPINTSLLLMNDSTLSFYFEDTSLRNNNYRNGTMTFYSPCHYILNNIYPYNYASKLHVYCVPILPDQTRVFVQYQHSNDTNNKLKQIYSILPIWVKHLFTMNFFDSDSMLLYKQEYHLQSINSLENCSKVYTTPTSSDYSIKGFHKWKNKYPQKWSNIINKHGITPSLNRQNVFDRYNRHTKNCKYCTRLLNNIKLSQFVFPIFLFMSGIISNNYVITLLSFIVYYLLDKYKSYFIYRDYVHNNL